MTRANFGLLALLVVVGGLLTGPFLAINYAPTLDAARDSVAHIDSAVALGAFLRGLHHWAGSFAIVLAAAHGARLFWRGLYKAPRRRVWVLGGLLFLVVVGFAYTGYLLPGDERAYTGMGIMAEVAGATPLVGDAAAAVVRGGDAVSSATLTRLYVMHVVVLPALLLFLVVAYVRAVRRIGEAPAGGYAAALARDAVAAAAVLVALGVCAWLWPPLLGFKADPAGPGSPDARPEWFLLWVNQLLRLVPGRTFLLAGALPGLLVVLALGLPWLARGAERRPAARKPEIAAAILIVAALGALTLVALATAPPRIIPAGEPVERAGDLAARTGAVLEKFKCGGCHIIDGGTGEEDPVNYTGPPLWRQAHEGVPAFRELYTREYFRRKVGDPVGFWSETQMIYTPRRLKPTDEELDLLERWFFGELARGQR
jgi:ubiquinol-cytochrome c reductase cytochrome b subunit